MNRRAANPMQAGSNQRPPTNQARQSAGDLPLRPSPQPSVQPQQGGQPQQNGTQQQPASDQPQPATSSQPQSVQPQQPMSDQPQLSNPQSQQSGQPQQPAGDQQVAASSQPQQSVQPQQPMSNQPQLSSHQSQQGGQPQQNGTQQQPAASSQPQNVQPQQPVSDQPQLSSPQSQQGGEPQQNGAQQQPASDQPQPAASAEHPASGQPASHQELAAVRYTPDPQIVDRVRRMYAAYAPEKLAEVDRIVARYPNKEERLLEILRSKYGPEPTSESNIGAVVALPPAAEGGGPSGIPLGEGGDRDTSAAAPNENAPQQPNTDLVEEGQLRSIDSRTPLSEQLRRVEEYVNTAEPPPPGETVLFTDGDVQVPPFSFGSHRRHRPDCRYFKQPQAPQSLRTSSQASTPQTPSEEAPPAVEVPTNQVVEVAPPAVPPEEPSVITATLKTLSSVPLARRFALSIAVWFTLVKIRFLEKTRPLPQHVLMLRIRLTLELLLPILVAIAIVISYAASGCHVTGEVNFVPNNEQVLLDADGGFVDPRSPNPSRLILVNSITEALRDVFCEYPLQLRALDGVMPSDVKIWGAISANDSSIATLGYPACRRYNVSESTFASPLFQWYYDDMACLGDNEIMAASAQGIWFDELIRLSLQKVNFLCFKVSNAVALVRQVIALSPQLEEVPKIIPFFDEMFLLRMLARFLAANGHWFLSGGGSSGKNTPETSLFFGGTRIFFSVSGPMDSGNTNLSTVILKANATLTAIKKVLNGSLALPFALGGFVVESNNTLVISALFGQDAYREVELVLPGCDVCSKSSAFWPKAFASMDDMMNTVGDDVWAYVNVTSFAVNNASKSPTAVMDITFRLNQSSVPSTSTIIEDLKTYYSYSTRDNSGNNAPRWFMNYYLSGFLSLQKSFASAFSNYTVASFQPRFWELLTKYIPPFINGTLAPQPLPPKNASVTNASKNSTNETFIWNATVVRELLENRSILLDWLSQLSNYTALPMPIGRHRNPGYFLLMGNILPLIIFFAQIITLFDITASIRMERQRNIPTLLRTSCQVRDSTMLLSWILPYCAVELFYAIPISFLFWISLWNDSDFSLILVSIGLYHLSILLLNVLFTVGISRLFPPSANTRGPGLFSKLVAGTQKVASSLLKTMGASGMGSMLAPLVSKLEGSRPDVVSYLTPMLTLSTTLLPLFLPDTVPRVAVIVLSCIFSPMSFRVGCSRISESEIQWMGLGWKSLGDTHSIVSPAHIDMKLALLLLVGNIGGYFVLSILLNSTRFSFRRDILGPCLGATIYRLRARHSTVGKGDQLGVPPMVSVANVTKLGTRGNVLLDDISLDIFPGQIVTVVGAAEAGKSVLCQMLTKELRASQGTVQRPKLRAHPPDQSNSPTQQDENADDMADLAKDLLAEGEERAQTLESSRFFTRSCRVGYAPQHVHLWPWLTVRENLRLLSFLKRRYEQFDEAVFAHDVEEVREAFHIPLTALEMCVGELTLAEERLVILASAMMARPPLVVVDDPSFEPIHSRSEAAPALTVPTDLDVKRNVDMDSNKGGDVALAMRRFVRRAVIEAADEPTPTVPMCVLVATQNLHQASVLSDTVLFLEKGKVLSRGTARDMMVDLAPSGFIITLQLSAAHPQAVKYSEEAAAIVKEKIPRATFISTTSSELRFIVPVMEYGVAVPNGTTAAELHDVLTTLECREAEMCANFPDRTLVLQATVGSAKPEDLYACSAHRVVGKDQQYSLEKLLLEAAGGVQAPAKPAGWKEVTGFASLRSREGSYWLAARRLCIAHFIHSHCFRTFHELQTLIYVVLLPLLLFGAGAGFYIAARSWGNAETLPMSIELYQQVTSLRNTVEKDVLLSIANEERVLCCENGLRYFKTLEVPVSQCAIPFPIDPRYSAVRFDYARTSRRLSSSLLTTPPLFGSAGRFSAFFCSDEYLNFTSQVLFNVSSRHSVAEGLLSAYEAQLRSFVDLENVSLMVRNHPLPLNAYERKAVESVGSLAISLLLALPFAILPSLSFGFLVQRRKNAIHQPGDGSPVLVYVSLVVVDLILIVPLHLVLFLVAFFAEIVEIVSPGTYGFVLRVTFLHQFCLSIIGAVVVELLPSMFISSMRVAILQSIYSVFVSLFLCISVLAAWAANESQDASPSDADLLRYFLRLIPSFCLGETFLNLLSMPLRNFPDSVGRGITASAFWDNLQAFFDADDGSHRGDRSITGLPMIFLGSMTLFIVLVFVIVTVGWVKTFWLWLWGSPAGAVEANLSIADVEMTTIPQRRRAKGDAVTIEHLTIEARLSYSYRALSAARSGLQNLSAKASKAFAEVQGKQEESADALSNQPNHVPQSASQLKFIAKDVSLSVPKDSVVALVDGLGFHADAVVSAIAGQLSGYECVPGVTARHTNGSILISERYDPFSCEDVGEDVQTIDGKLLRREVRCAARSTPVCLASSASSVLPWATVDGLLMHYIMLRNQTKCYLARNRIMTKLKMICRLPVGRKEVKRTAPSSSPQPSSDRSHYGSRKVATLTLVEQRKVLIACAMANFPPLLCLVAPFKGLVTQRDKRELLAVIRNVRDLCSATVVLSTETTDDVYTLADLVAVLSPLDGSVRLHGTVEEVFQTGKVMSSLTTQHGTMQDAILMKAFMTVQFPSSLVESQQLTKLVFTVPRCPSCNSNASNAGSPSSPSLHRAFPFPAIVYAFINRLETLGVAEYSLASSALNDVDTVVPSKGAAVTSIVVGDEGDELDDTIRALLRPYSPNARTIPAPHKVNPLFDFNAQRHLGQQAQLAQEKSAI